MSIPSCKLMIISLGLEDISILSSIKITDLMIITFVNEPKIEF